MQQIQLSPVKFDEEQIAQQQEELNSKIDLLVKTVAIDQITLLFFYPEGEPEISPSTEFCSIIKKNIPATKTNQIQTIQRITFCFYCLLVEAKLDNLLDIELDYQWYLERTTFVSTFVNFHQRVRQWCKQLVSTKDFTKSRQILLAIFLQIKEKNQTRLEILSWKISVCLILFQIISQKNKIQRNEVIKLLKTFKHLKKQNKISTKPILNAFKFMVKYFISINDDLYVFFERQLKIWSQQIVDNTLISEIKSLILQCEQLSSQRLKNTTNDIIKQKSNAQSRLNSTSQGRKIVMNILNPHLFSQSNPSLISGRRMIRRRPSKEKEEEFSKKIQHFLKTRSDKNQSKSLQSTPRLNSQAHLKVSIKISQKPSLSLHSISRFTLDQANIFKNIIKPNVEEKKSQTAIKQFSRVSFSASKSGSSFYRKGSTRKRKQVYQKIAENDGNQRLITNRHLKDQMFQLEQVREQRCKISLEEILIGQLKKTQADPNIKFMGVSEDNQFGNMSLSFFTIFNQQLAQIFFTLRKVGKQGYLLTCQTKSTYCNYPSVFIIQKKESRYSQFTFDDLNEILVNSVIYYEALQQKAERTISVSQIQALQQLLRQILGVQLSQFQLTKLLTIVDLLQSYFFWYYTKANHINGYRLEKRLYIDFQDLSAFAVSLGKFKSDYDSCLDQIVMVQNTKSLVETCIYLSYGRKIVHKAIRKIRDIYYLQVIYISDKVYQSFSRKDKKPFFKNTTLRRQLLKTDEFTSSTINVIQFQQFKLNNHKQYINLGQILQQKDAFIFFMKNIVQNFIQIKYIYKIQQYLLKLNIEENFEIFDEKQIKLYQRHNLDIIANNQQLSEQKQFKPLIHRSIKHLRQILLRYCQVYQLDNSFIIIKKNQHLIPIHKKTYIINQIVLSNNLRILYIFKRGKRQNYNLFMYHQRPTQIRLLNTSFHSRFVMVDNKKLIGNLIRRQKAQMFLSDDSTTVTRNIIKFENGYCYINVSQCQSIICWRFDYYFPQYQAQYSTFLDQYIYLECLGEWAQNQQMWKQTIQKIKINFKEQHINLHNQRVKLFRSLKRLYFDEKQARGILQLIQYQGQLLFLITSFEEGTLSVGKVENVMHLNHKLLFSSSINKWRIGMYDNIMNNLYYKVLNGKLPSEIIGADYFIHQEES